MRLRASICCALLVGLLVPTYGQVLTSDPLRQLAEVAKSYSIEIVTDSPTFPVKLSDSDIQGKPAEKSALEAYVPTFVSEFSLYPKELIARAKLKRVVLCEGLALSGQLRAAVPDWEHDTLYLDVSRGRTSKLYQNRVLHHEFFHFLDYKDDGKVYRDDDWAKLNSPGFKYGSGGAKVQDNRKTGVPTTEYAGFVDHYATTGVEEDKAETFTYMITDAAYLAERCKAEPVLAAKVSRIRELMAKFCPKMGEAFWQRAAAVQRG